MIRLHSRYGYIHKYITVHSINVLIRYKYKYAS